MTYKVTVTEDVTDISVSGNTTSINITGEQTEISVVNPATSVTFTPSQSFSATNVQDALLEAYKMVGQQINNFDISLSYGNDFIIDDGSDNFFKLHASGGQAGWQSYLWATDDIFIRTHSNVDIAEFGDTTITFAKPIYMNFTQNPYIGFINTTHPTNDARHHYRLFAGTTNCGFIGSAYISSNETFFMGNGGYSVAFDNDTYGGSFFPANSVGAKSDDTHSLGKTDARFKELHLSDSLYVDGAEFNNGNIAFDTNSFIVKNDSGNNIFLTSNTTAVLFHSGSTKLRTLSTGVRVTGELTSTGVINADSGINIGDSNTDLDDYEEGTWTPVLRCSNVLNATVNNATYVKIGNKVTVSADFGNINTSTASSGATVIQGLPFQPNHTFPCIITNSNIFTGFEGIVSGITNVLSTTIDLRQSRHTDNIANTDIINTTNGKLVFQCTYETNS